MANPFSSEYLGFNTDLAIHMHLTLFHLHSNMADFRHITRLWRHTQNLYYNSYSEVVAVELHNGVCRTVTSGNRARNVIFLKYG